MNGIIGTVQFTFFANCLFITMFFFAVVITLLYIRDNAKGKYLAGLKLNKFEETLFKDHEKMNLEKELEMRNKYCGLLDKEKENV